MARRTGTSVNPTLPNLGPSNPSIPTTHQDYGILRDIVDGLLTASGGVAPLQALLAGIVRATIDRVIQTPKTGRRFYKDLQNSEKTYIGTAVEIDLRSDLGLARGANLVDLNIAGHDCDVKFTKKFAWNIPPKEVGGACLLISADDEKSVFSLGVIIARDEYLNPGRTRDSKRTIRAADRVNIWWIFQKALYPKNFWLSVPTQIITRISDGRSGNERAMVLLREIRDTPIPRKIVEDVGAGQEDFMRRFRGDKGRKNGTRDILLTEGILVLHGHWKRDRALIDKLGLPPVSDSEYMSHRLKPREIPMARAAGFNV